MYFKKIASLICVIIFIVGALYSCTSKSKPQATADTSRVEMQSGAATSSEMMTDTTSRDSTTVKH